MTDENRFVGDVGLTSPTGSRDLRSYTRVLWRWKFLLIAIIVLIPVAVYLYERGRPKVYRASSLVQVTGGSSIGVAALVSGNVGSSPDTTDLLVDARLVETSALAREAAKYVHPRPSNPGALALSISTSPDQDTGFLTITGSSSSPQQAANIANAFAQALVANQTQATVREVNAGIQQLRTQLKGFPPGDPDRTQVIQALARLRALRVAEGANVVIVQTATPPSSPLSPRVTRSVILAIIVAVLLALGAVAIAEGLDRRVRNPDDVGDATGLPLLSAIPAEAFSAPMGSARVIDSVATLRSSLTYFNIDRRLSTILITSPGKEDGKTAVAIQLAQSMARAGKNVILLDTDLRRPAVGERLGIRGRPGLGAVLVGETPLDEALMAQTGSNGRRGSLWVLPAGPPPPNPSELLGSQRMREILAELTERCDMVIIDSTPLLTVSDSMPLLPHVSGVLMLGRIDRTSREALARLRFVIDSAGGHAIGTVATGARGGGLYVAAGYGYETAYSPAGEEERPARGLGRLRRRQANGPPEHVSVGDPQ